MPVSIKDQITAAVQAAVGGEYGFPAADDKRDLPSTRVVEDDETSSDSAYGYSVRQLPFVIAKAEVPVDRLPSQSREEYQDVMRARCNEMQASIEVALMADPTVKSLVESIEYTGGSIAIELGQLCFAESEFLVTFHTVKGDPYTQ
ncbi:MAG: hypothetical protein AAGI72_23705 [Pseudomonadota bacterium]